MQTVNNSKRKSKKNTDLNVQANEGARELYNIVWNKNI